MTPALAWAPSLALAKYTDTGELYAAPQDLSDTAASGLAAIGQSIYPQVVTAGDIVDGTYVVPDFTSSRMCTLYASLGHATAKTNPNQVDLAVSGESMTATFYMSGAYTAVYFGSVESYMVGAQQGASAARGKLITIVSRDQQESSNQQSVLQGDLLQLAGLAPGQMAAIASLALLALGAAPPLIRSPIPMFSR